MDAIRVDVSQAANAAERSIPEVEIKSRLCSSNTNREIALQCASMFNVEKGGERSCCEQCTGFWGTRTGWRRRDLLELGPGYFRTMDSRYNTLTLVLLSVSLGQRRLRENWPCDQ